MAEDTTRLIIQVETLLKGLDKTLRGLGQVEAQLKRITTIKVGGTTTTTQLDRATAAARRLELQQQRLAIQSQNLANKQERADQTTARLALGQQRLAAAQERLSRASGAQADAHVRAFRAIEDGTKKANQAIIGLGNSLRSVGQGLTSLGATLSVTLTAPIVALGTASVGAAVQMDSLKRGLTAIVGSSTEASRQLARLTELAKLPGIGFEEAIQGSIRLQAVGFSAKEAERSLKEFANAVALTGGGREELQRITVQLGQLAAKGKVLSQDLRPIIEAAPAVGRALKEAFGTVNADDIADLTSSSKEFLDILVTQLEKLPRAAAGAKNAFENFRDTVFRAAAAIGEALLPTLTQLVDILGPLITSIAEGFRSLPAPLRTTLVIVTALFAAIGPVVFVVGQLTTGIGRIIVGLAQLNALGLLPTIRNLRLFTAGTLAAAEAEGTLAAASAATGVAIAGLAGILGAIVVAYIAWQAAQSSAVEVTQEQLDASKEQVDALKEQAKFLDGLKDGVQRTADEQDKLREIYNALNTEAQARVLGINDEEKRLAALRAEIEKLIQARLQEREQQIAAVVAGLADAAARKQIAETQSAAISDQIERNRQLITSIENVGDASKQVARTSAEQARAQQGVGQSAEDLRIQNLGLVKQYNDLQETLSGPDGLNNKTKELGDRLRAVGVTTSDQIRQFLATAQALGLFNGNIDQTVAILERYIQVTEKATATTDEFQKALTQQTKETLAAGAAADELQKKRRALISAAGDTAREAAKDFQGALKFMRAFIAAQPELKAAIEREAQVQGKSIAEVIDQALGATGGRRDSALRNAQAALAKQLEDVAKADAEKQLAINEQKNEQLLNDNETAFKQQLISYQQYLTKRAALTVDNLNEEIKVQLQEIVNARNTQDAILKLGGATAAERTKRAAQVAAALERQTKAETKVAQLETKRDDILARLKQTQAETALQQERDIRQLEIDYANLQGRIESAFRAETVERFRESLQELGVEQKFLGEQLKRLDLTAEEKAIIRLKQEQNQRQVELTRNIIRTSDALATLRGSEQAVTDAKQRQTELEQRLDFLVRFRGLAEEEAIRRRLEGEALVRDAIDQQRAKLEALAAGMKAAGLAIPRALADAISELKVEALGLGELDFTERFRLAQKEFDKLNDARIQKIQEVERAVAHRDISELQGRIAIRAANGEYVEALEKQLAVLQQIAAASGDIGLQKQAADARTTTAEVRNATTEVADLNTEIRSISIDALRDSFGNFLNSLRHGADAAKDALNGMIDSVLSRVNEAIANRLFDKFLGPLLGGVEVGVGSVGGLGGAVAGAGGGALQASAAAAGAALTAGGTTAGAALTTGGAVSAASITTAAAAFAASVAAAGAAFAATVAAAAGAQAVGSVGGAFAGAAATGLFPAVPGGAIHIVEGGHPEAVLTTDPKHAVRQMAILREYLAKTRGLWGRIPQFEAGGMVSASQVEAGLLRSLSSVRGFSAPSPSADMQLASPSINLRNINLIDRGQLVGGHLRSAEGARDILNVISTERDEVGRRIGVR